MTSWIVNLVKSVATSIGPQMSLERDLLIAYRLLTKVWQSKNRAYELLERAQSLAQTIAVSHGDNVPQIIKDRLVAIRDERIRKIALELNEVQQAVTTSQNKYAQYVSQFAPFDTSIFPWRFKNYMQYCLSNCPRSIMPQIDKDNINEVRDSLIRQFGSPQTQSVRIGDLRPSQSEINGDKVMSMLIGMDMLNDRTWFIGNDYRLIDGHHQWAALLQLNPDGIIEIERFDVPAENIINLLYTQRNVPKVDINDQSSSLTALQQPATKKYGSVVWTCCNDRYLILRRGDGAPWAPGLWFLPGGTWDKNAETAFDVAKRELLEECCINCNEMFLIGVAQNDDWMVYCYYAAVDDTDVDLNYEHDDYLWTDVEEVKRLPHPPELDQHIAFIERYRDMRSVNGTDIIKSIQQQKNLPSVATAIATLESYHSTVLEAYGEGKVTADDLAVINERMRMIRSSVVKERIQKSTAQDVVSELNRDELIELINGLEVDSDSEIFTQIVDQLESH